MRELQFCEVHNVSGGDGYFKVIVMADVPHDCAQFVANTWESFLINDISFDDVTNIMFASDFDTIDIERAFEGLDVLYWL